MDAVNLLKKDHSYVLSLFNKFDQTGRNSFDKKFRLYDEIRSELELHSHVEEEIFYPTIRDIGSEGRKLISEAVKEHKQVDVLIGQIDRLSPDDPNFDDRMQALMEQVEHHIGEEEQEIFKLAAAHCSEEQLENMGRKIEAMKASHYRRAA
jgi:hemerythrin superfamily protein